MAVDPAIEVTHVDLMGLLADRRCQGEHPVVVFGVHARRHQTRAPPIGMPDHVAPGGSLAVELAGDVRTHLQDQVVGFISVVFQRGFVNAPRKVLGIVARVGADAHERQGRFTEHVLHVPGIVRGNETVESTASQRDGLAIPVRTLWQFNGPLDRGPRA